MKYLVILFSALFLLSACGKKVEVPPAHMGKILGKTGFTDELIPPSKFRLPVCFAYCDKLIVIEASDVAIEESMKLFMPKDQLNLAFDVRMTASINTDKKVLNRIFDRVTARMYDDREGHISLDRVYEIYGKQILRSAARGLMANYSINQIAENREKVEAELFQAMREELAVTPINLIHLGLADIQFPEVIVAAKEAAKKREVEIEQAEADKQIRLVEAETELELAKKDRLIRLEKARTILEENKVVSASVTTNYLQYRYLEVMEAMAASGSAVFFPVEMVDSVGLHNRLFEDK